MTRSRVISTALALLGVFAVAILVAGAMVPRRLDYGSTRPDGAKGLALLLNEFSGPVDLHEQVPDTTIDRAILLIDHLSIRASDQLEAWVFAGGTLVVADPTSDFAPLPGAPLALAARDCDIPALSDVEQLSAAGGRGFNAISLDGWCYGQPNAAMVTVQRFGGGLFVAVADSSIFENQRLGAADNAVLAVALGAPEMNESVALLEPELRPLPPPTTSPSTSPPTGENREDGDASTTAQSEVDGSAGDGDSGFDRRDLTSDDLGLFSLLPPYLRWVMLTLGAAFLVLAVAKGRRLGAPVEERPFVQIAASELVRARGRLYRGSQDGIVVSHIRTGVRADLAAAVSLTSHVDDDTLARVVARRTDFSEGQIKAALNRQYHSSDVELVKRTQTLDAILQEVQRDRSHSHS